MTTSQARTLVEEAACRVSSAQRLLADVLTGQGDLDPGLAVWGAWTLLERARPFLDQLADATHQERTP